MLRSSARGLVSLISQHQGCLTAHGQAASPVGDIAQAGVRNYISDPKVVVRTKMSEHEPSTEDILFCNEKTGESIAAHPGLRADALSSALLKAPTYSKEYAERVNLTHKVPHKLYERFGYMSMCNTFGPLNLITGYSSGTKMNEAKWVNHMIFMESVLGCPGMVAAMWRHMNSLRSLQKDHGWIHTLLLESENSRMHLLMFMQMSQPSFLLRTVILLTQAFVFNVYLLSYILAPKMCHAYTGYLNDEAFKCYTRMLKDIDLGNVENSKAPEMAIDYWRLDPATASLRDVILAARADVACHACVNHTLSSLKPTDANPFAKGSEMSP